MRISDWSSDVCSSDLRWRMSSPPLRGSPRRTRHEPADRTQPRPDPVPALVPDPGRAVLAVSAPAAALAAQALRPGQPGAGGRRVHGLAVLGAGPCRSRARADVAAGAGHLDRLRRVPRRAHACRHRALVAVRSEENTSELQSLMRISYAVFCLKKNKKTTKN